MKTIRTFQWYLLYSEIKIIRWPKIRSSFITSTALVLEMLLLHERQGLECNDVASRVPSAVEVKSKIRFLVKMWFSFTCHFHWSCNFKERTPQNWLAVGSLADFSYDMKYYCPNLSSYHKRSQLWALTKKEVNQIFISLWNKVGTARKFKLF